MKIKPINAKKPVAEPPMKTYTYNEILYREGVYKSIKDYEKNSSFITIASTFGDNFVTLYFNNNNLIEPIRQECWERSKFIETNEEVVFGLQEKA